MPQNKFQKNKLHNKHLLKMTECKKCTKLQYTYELINYYWN